MARGRKTQYVKKITSRDVKLFKQISRTGLADRTQAKDFCNINPNRIDKLEKSGYIKTKSLSVNGQNTQIIQLDKVGKKFCKDELDIKSFAVAQTNHVSHDLKLSLVYYSLPGKIQDTWQHERDIIKEIYENHPEIPEHKQLNTCIDAKIILEDGSEVAIEAVGDSYGKIEMQEKEAIAINLANCESIYYV